MHFNFAVEQKNDFSRHFNLVVFRPRPRNHEIFMPRNFHAIKYFHSYSDINKMECEEQTPTKLPLKI